MNPLPFDSLSPMMVEVEPHDIHGNGWNSDDTWRQEANDLEDKGSDESSESGEDDGVDNDGSAEDDPAPGANRWESRQPSSLQDAQACLIDINQMLKPPRPKGHGGYKQCCLPLHLRTRLEWVVSFLHVYTDKGSEYGNSAHGSH
jgi:hypothetical protein